MKYSNLSKKSIIPFIGILLAIFLLGCGQGVVNNQENNQFDGIWEMEYNKSMSSFIEPGYYENPISIELSSILTFEADSFNLQIIAHSSFQYLNREYTGNYSISADTIIFNATYYPSFNIYDTNDSVSNIKYYLMEKLRFNFDNQDSLKFSVISIAVSDSMFSIPMSSFLWHTSDLWPPMKTSGTYTRIDIE